MITPRTTRLVRVENLHRFRQVVTRLSSADTLVVVPTRGAARQLAGVSGLIVTRAELYDDLHARLPQGKCRLTIFERHSLMSASAAVNKGLLPFVLRPGVVSEMLRFYDEIKRQAQSVRRFEELLHEALGAGADDLDRGTERLLRQTSFLAASFHEYERRVAASDGCDEHVVRSRLLVEPVRPAARHVVVTGADWIADPDGLYAADFDLLSQLPNLEAIDLVCSERTLGSGFHQRLHNWWPGVDEVEAAAIVGSGSATRPSLVIPDHTAVEQPWQVYRDREEELLAVGRRLARASRQAGPLFDPARTAVVFKRPLPYLYLAPDAFGAIGIPFQSADALPLAAEPTAAALDLVIECAETGFTRDTLVSLLKSPHFRFTVGGEPLPLEQIPLFDRLLSERRYLGDPARLSAMAEPGSADSVDSSVRAVLDAAVMIAESLGPLRTAARASVQLTSLLEFLQRHMTSECVPREVRARSAIFDTLAGLAAAHAAHHDPDWTIADLGAALRGWVGERTFAAEPSSEGVHLLDDQAARYGDFDHMVLVGLVEHEWPQRPRRNIFYSAAALKTLGWPSERERSAAEGARFLDLLESARETVRLSTFTLEDETLVVRSMQLDDVVRARLSTVPDDQATDDRWYPDERLTADPVDGEGSAAASSWLALRLARTQSGDPVFHGSIGQQPSRPWSVSALETYLECPFKFYARHALRLREEPDDEEVMDPRRQGQFVHEVFESFFREWQAGGQGTISAANLPGARAMFTDVVDRLLAGVSDAEAGLERTRLLGSSAAAGLGEAVLRMEAERPVPVVERLLEHRLEGTFRLETTEGERIVALRGKADRLDLLADGTFRLIDYKLGWPPNRARALQLPIYAVCATQRLDGYKGRRWELGEAAYLAFKGPRRVVPLFSTAADRDAVIRSAQQRLAAAIDAIDRGEFPPAPDDVYRCESCDFAAVCRRDYVGDV